MKINKKSEKSKKRLRKSLIGLLLNQLIEFWPLYLGALICLVITHLAQTQIPFFARDLGLLAEKGKLDEAPISLYLLLAACVLIFRTGSRLLFFLPARILQKYLKLEMIDLIENAYPGRYEKYSSGQLFQILQNDFDQLRAMVGFAFLQVFNAFIALFIIIPRIVDFHGHLLIAFTPLVVGLLFFSLAIIKAQRFFRLAQDQQGEVQQHLIESYEGKKTIQNYHSEKAFLGLFQQRSDHELETFYKASLKHSYATPIINLCVGLSLLWGAYLIQINNLGKENLILFSGFVFLFKEPLMFVSWIGVIFGRSMASWKRITELVQNLITPSMKEKSLSETPHPQVLFWGKELPLTIRENKWTVFFAKTGHGKSTVILNLADIYLLNDRPVSLVHQSPYLYNDTISKNIFLGKDPSPQEIDLVKKYLKIFSLQYLAENLDDVLNLEIGENGKKISGGQGKRIALIRSLMSDRPILIWDDPFSSVDLISEKEILEKLRKRDELKQKTIIFTSHRLSTVKYCDDLIYLDKEMGIMEQGPVDELLTSFNSKTYEYFQKQMA